VTLGDYDPTGVNKPLPGTESTILAASGASARVVYHGPALAFDTGGTVQRLGDDDENDTICRHVANGGNREFGRF
jgi:hypothetical protein